MKSTIENICIFCREKKAKFSEEHVFPATIGGAFIITTVCAECNRILGDKIDNPLARHELILLNRHNFQIKRKGKIGTRKNIPNPFSGKHIDEDGNEFNVIFNEKGEARSKIIPKYKETTGVDGSLMLTYIIAKEDFKDEETIKRRTAKRLGIPVEQIMIKDITETPIKPIIINKLTPNNPLILGALKIAYEFGVTFIPDYLNDPISKEYSEILLTQIVQKKQKKYFSENFEIKKEILQQILKINGLQIYHNFAILKCVKGRGLFCFIKIFDFTFLITLSKKDIYELKNDLCLFNDAVNQIWNMNIPAKLTHFNISVNLAENSQISKQTIANSGQNAFVNQLGKLPIYDKNGVLKFTHIDQLAETNINNLKHYDHFNKQISVPVNYPIGQYYLRCTKDKSLIALDFVNYIYSLEY